VTLSTVYLRYHYVVDVVAGVLLAWFSVTGWMRLHDRLAEAPARP
jgi:membrane-associated phospholipid phosphatase